VRKFRLEAAKASTGLVIDLSGLEGGTEGGMCVSDDVITTNVLVIGGEGRERGREGGREGGLAYLEAHTAGLEGGRAHLNFEKKILHVLGAFGLPTAGEGGREGGREGERERGREGWRARFRKKWVI